MSAQRSVPGRGRGPGGSQADHGVDGDHLIDAATLVVVCVLVFWSLSVDTILDFSLTSFVRGAWATYPVASVAGMTAAILLARAAWRAGLAARVVPEPSSSFSVQAQVGMAVGPLLAPPALELVADLRGQPDQPFLLFTGTAALIAIACVRTARLVRSERQARRELVAARDTALEASCAKSTFLANVSHEVRTPLTTVLAAAELLEDTPLTAAQLALVEKLERSGGLLKTLVEGILDFSRIEAGLLELSSTQFDLHDLVTDVADVYVPRAAQTGIAFRCDLDPRLPRDVLGDPRRVFQVLTHLLDNALKFTDHGDVDLLVRPAPAQLAAGTGEVVELVVRDTGIGIRSKDHESVFESFSQVDGSMTRQYGGSGLGLAVCRELVELMGGSISLQSELGSGSTFVVRVPMPRPASTLETPAAALPLAG